MCAHVITFYLMFAGLGIIKRLLLKISRMNLMLQDLGETTFVPLQCTTSGSHWLLQMLIVFSIAPV